MQLALGLKNKDSFIYSVLLSALKEINDGKRKYIIPKKIYYEIIRAMNTKSCVDAIDICKYSNYHKYISHTEEAVLKLINKNMIELIFIFYRC